MLTGDGDKVKCFHCDGLLYNWEPEDSPFVEHARWFPKCQYIQLVKGENFVRDVQSGKVTQDDVMQTPAVLAVLFDGYSVETVQGALADLRKKDGKTFGGGGRCCAQCSVCTRQSVDQCTVLSVSGLSETSNLLYCYYYYYYLIKRVQSIHMSFTSAL